MLVGLTTKPLWRFFPQVAHFVNAGLERDRLVCVELAQMRQHVSFWNFLNFPMEYGRIITSRMDATAKVSMLRNLNSLAFDQLLQSYMKDVLDSVDAIKEDRNLIVHGTRGRTSPDKTPMALSLRIKDTPSTVVSETFPRERTQEI